MQLFLFWVNGMRVLQEVDMISCLDHLSIMTQICCVVFARLIRTFSTPSENFVSVWNLVNLLFTQKTLLKLRIYHKYYLHLYICKYMKLVLEGSIEIIVPEGFGLELELGLWDFVIYELQFLWIHILIRYRENFTTIL